MLAKIRQFAVVKGGAGFPHEDQGVRSHPIPFYKVGALGEASVEGYLQDAADTVTEETALALGARVFPAGTVTFAKVGEALKLNRFCLLKERACLDNNMMGLILDAQKAHPRFVRYALSIRDMAELVNPGAVPSVNGSQVGNILVWLPSPGTQTAITNYLDAKTAAIGALIAKKELLIEELKKYQEAVIAEAVKPREGWQKMRLKQCVREKISTGVGEAGTQYEEGHARYLRTSDIGSLFTLKSEDLRTLPPEVSIQAPVHKGDILVTTAGSVGKTYLHSSDGEFCYAGFLAKVSLRDQHKPRFFAYLLASRLIQEEIAQAKVSSTIDNFSASKLGELAVSVPSPQVQEEVVADLDRKLGALEAVQENAANSLKELKSLRSALISEAVTGKLQLPA